MKKRYLNKKTLTDNNYAQTVLSLFVEIEKIITEYSTRPYHGEKDSSHEKEMVSRIRREIKVNMENSYFMEGLEKFVNEKTGGKLNQVYSVCDRLNKNQKRLLSFLLLGLSTNTVCLLLDISPDVFYNRKRRLIQKLKDSDSQIVQEIVKKL